MAETNGKDDQGAFAAQLMKSGARAFAAAATERLLADASDRLDRYGPGVGTAWHEHLTARVRELAASVEMGRRELFVRQIEWARLALEARGVAPEDFHASVRALGASLQEELPESAWRACRPHIEAALASFDRDVGPTKRLAGRDDHERLALRYIEMVLVGRRRDAMELMVATLREGMPLADVYERVLLPAEFEIGTMWHLGEVSVCEENLTTETSRAVMAVLSHASARRPARRGTVVAGVVEGDQHGLAIRAAADLLDLAGFRTICIDGGIPADDLAAAVTHFSADAALLSSTIVTQLALVRDTIALLRGRRDGLRVVVGGPAFSGDPALAWNCGADALAASPSDAVRILEEMLGPDASAPDAERP